LKIFSRIKFALNPENWTLKSYVFVAIFLIAINALGSQGLIKIVLMHQEESRLSNLIQDQQNKLASLEKDIQRFKKSDIHKLKTIREELGLLKSDEISFEFTDRDPSNPESP
jgi:hypothetical protein